MGNMTAEGMIENKIKQKRYHLPVLYHMYVDWCVLRLKESCIRVKAMYAAMGYLIDSKSRKRFFNVAALERTDNVLSEILLDLYSNQPTILFNAICVRENGTKMANKNYLCLLTWNQPS
jgi:hypothetical protein